ncbi:hypothetical protein V6N13_107792 [Hibiscus sabdariffa]|uniref:Uncharacterized protein n=1 Tax=Hibiscus sabdariffa TaxID=183260 RepID=A0ABR2SQM2_9ROSI
MSAISKFPATTSNPNIHFNLMTQKLNSLNSQLIVHMTHNHGVPTSNVPFITNNLSISHQPASGQRWCEPVVRTPLHHPLKNVKLFFLMPCLPISVKSSNTWRN